jgi:hypothetical protein
MSAIQATVDLGQLIRRAFGAIRPRAAWIAPPIAERMELEEESSLARSASPSAVAAEFQVAIAMRSHILPSCGHPLEKTVRSIGG